MIIISGLILSALLFLSGVFFIIRGQRQIEDDHKIDTNVVPITNFSEIYSKPKEEKIIQKIVVAPKEEPGELLKIVEEKIINKDISLNVDTSLSDNSLNQEKAITIDSLLKEKYEMLLSKNNEITIECNKYKDALEREISNRNVSSSLNDQQKKSHEQLLERVQHLEGSFIRLTGENNKLQKINQEQIVFINQLELKSKDINSQPENILNEELKIKAIKKEFLDYQQEIQNKFEENHLMVERLKQEKVNLLKKQDQSQQQISQLLHEIQILKIQVARVPEVLDLSSVNIDSDVKNLREELNSFDEKFNKMKENEEYLRLSYEQKINDLNKEIYELKNQFCGSDPSSGLMKIDPLAVAKVELEELNTQMNLFKRRNQELQEEYEKIKRINEQLIIKDDLIQYEFTKFRAQALGLESICENFKEQLEAKEVIID